jgi:hypothetical protein
VIECERLCRLMCGKAEPFRLAPEYFLRLRLKHGRHSLETKIETVTESQRLSAHQAAKPLKPGSLTCFSSRAYSLLASFPHDTQALLLLLLVRL